MNTFLIIFIVFILILGLWAVSNLIAVFGGSPPVHTSQDTCSLIIKLVNAKSRDTVLDLGSGTGNILIAAREAGAKSIGYEISPYPFLISRIRTMFSGNIRIHFASIFESKPSEATIIYMYLLPKMLISIAPKIKREAKPGTVVVTRGFPLPGWQPIKRVTLGREKTKIFVYKVK